MQKYSITFFVLFLVITALLIPVILESGEKDVEKEIKAVVKGSVEDVEWMNAKSEQHLNKLLGKYFAGEILEQNTKSAMEFINTPTDWYWETNVETIHIIYLEENKATVIAYLIDINLNDTGETCHGEVICKLHSTSEGWRIKEAYYHWGW